MCYVYSTHTARTPALAERLSRFLVGCRAVGSNKGSGNIEPTDVVVLMLTMGEPDAWSDLVVSLRVGGKG